MSSEAQRRASAKYDKANKMTLTIKLNKRTEGDLIAFLDTLENKQGFIKALIRGAMKGDNNGTDEG